MNKKIQDPKEKKWQKRRTRTRNAIGRTDRVMLTIFRSTKHIYAQLIEPETGKTLGAVSSRQKDVLGDLESTGGVEAAKRVGTAVARLAKDKDIDKVVFNRNGFLYHGRVKALAEAAREAGLQF